MVGANKVYKNPVTNNKSLLQTIASGWKTPILRLKFCNIVKPYYYQNSPRIPRYSITCSIDQDSHPEFIKNIQNIEKKEGVESILKEETVKENKEFIPTGKLLLKFGTKELIPVYLGDLDVEIPQNPSKIELEDELAEGERVMVIFDILRYTKKHTTKTEHGLSFKPTCIYYFPKD